MGFVKLLQVRAAILDLVQVAAQSFYLVAYNFYREFFLYVALQYVFLDFCMDNNGTQNAEITINLIRKVTSLSEELMLLTVS